MRYSIQIIAGLIICSLAACSDGTPAAPAKPPTAPAKPAPPPPTSIRSVDGLTPGGRATLYGISLDSVSQLSVGGGPVQIEARTDTSLTFPVPVFHACETDGRRVPVVATTPKTQVLAEGQIKVSDALQMRIGELRTLAPSELGCLRLPRGSAEYVLLTRNLARTAPVGVDTLFRFHDESRANPASASLRSAAQGPAVSALELNGARGGEHASDLAGVWDGGMRSEAVKADLFDGRMSTAQVGDTLRLVDFLSGKVSFSTPRDQVATYDAVVIAVVGKAVFLLDTRAPASITAGIQAALPTLRSTGAALDELVTPTMRAVFDPAFQIPSVADGRHFVIFTDIGFSGGVGNVAEFQRAVSSSGYLAGYLSWDAIGKENAWSAQKMVWIALHEYGHAVHMKTQAELTNNTTSLPYSEGWAVSVEETAGRIWGRAESDAPSWPERDGLVVGWSPHRAIHGSPYGRSYAPGALVLLYAREQIGAAGFRPSVPLLYQRVARERDENVLAAVAREVGIPLDTLLARTALAGATDDRISTSQALAAGIPHLRSRATEARVQRGWDAGWPPSIKPISVFAEPGGFDVHDFITKPEQGLSAVFSGVSQTVPVSVQLIRVR